jgi:hypothetical protein
MIFRYNAEPEKSPKCTSEFCFKSSSSAGKRHLETAHPRKYRSMFGSEEQNTNVITNYVYNKPIEYSIETFKKAVVRLFVMLNLPISAAESPHFREFCSFLRPRVAEFSADTATRVIHAEYNVYFERLKKLLAENDSKISLTTDGWSSKSLTPFSTLTGHWLDKDFKLHSTILGFKMIVGEHTGEKMCLSLAEWLVDFGILHKFLAITTDNASNNEKMMEMVQEAAKAQNFTFNKQWQWIRYVTRSYTHILPSQLSSSLCQPVLPYRFAWL